MYYYGWTISGIEVKEYNLCVYSNCCKLTYTYNSNIQLGFCAVKKYSKNVILCLSCL